MRYFDEDYETSQYGDQVPDYDFDECPFHPDDPYWAEHYEPQYVATCPECGEGTEFEIVNNMCETCCSDKSYAELQSVRIYNGESIQTQVNKYNDILEKYGYDREYEWCSDCQRPTIHEELYVQGRDALPCETEYGCLSCEDKRYGGE